MTTNLLVHAVDQRESAMCEATARGLAGIDPDGEELCREIACACGVEIQHAAGVYRRSQRASKVPCFIDEALRRIGVSVDDERGCVNIGRGDLVV